LRKTDAEALVTKGVEACLSEIDTGCGIGLREVDGAVNESTPNREVFGAAKGEVAAPNEGDVDNVVIDVDKGLESGTGCEFPSARTCW
jgi:hypothetical protein